LLERGVQRSIEDGLREGSIPFYLGTCDSEKKTGGDKGHLSPECLEPMKGIYNLGGKDRVKNPHNKKKGIQNKKQKLNGIQKNEKT